MKDEGAIKQKLKQVKYRHLQKLLKASFKENPVVCPDCDHSFQLKEKEVLKREFNEFISTASRAEIAYRYPDMAALMWVLDRVEAQEHESLAPIVLTEAADQPEPKPNWWECIKRFCGFGDSDD